MASTHKSLRSGTANKRPTTSIADGQIALNTNTTSPGLFFKDSTGATIIKIGPVHVGTTAPNASPAAGGSSGNSTGEVWLDASLTPNGVKIWNGASWTNATPIGSTTVQGLLELATSAETQTGTDPDRAVTPAGLQSKVSDSTSTTSSTTIASSTAVKSAYDLANAALPKSGGTVTGNLEIGTTGSLSFEGATADAFETTIAVVDPTADRTITLPDTTGTIVTTGDTGTVTSTMIADGTIVDADISASAEIAVSKLADGAARQLLQTDAAGTGVEWASNIDIPGTLDVTSAATFDSSVAVTGALTKSGSNVVTVGDTGTVTSTMIADGTILNADVNASAAIAGTKISPDFGSQTIATTGIVSHALGTAGAPTVTFTGDTNTGIYSPGADQVAISTNGTGRLFVDASGRVSVGASPTTRIFEITSSQQVVGVIKSSSTASSRLGLQDANSTDDGQVSVAAIGNSLGLYAGASERLRITSAGLVGIGTSSPSYRLHSRDDSNNIQLMLTNASGTASATAGLLMSNDAYTGAQITYNMNTHASEPNFLVVTNAQTGIGFNTAGTRRMTIDASGRLGVGTSSPTNKLDVVGTTQIYDSRGTSGYDSLKFIGGSAADFPTIEAVSATSPLYFKTNSNVRMAITAAGNVGVGTTAPSNTLEVAGAATTNLFAVKATSSGDCLGVTARSAGNGAIVSALNSAQSDYEPLELNGEIIYFQTRTGTGTVSERARIDSSGRLLVGTSSSQGKWNNSSGDDHLVQIESTSPFSQSWISHSTSSTAGVQLDLGRSRGTSSGSTTLVNDGDLLGHICFQGADGSEFVRSALIQAYVDGTPGANDMPGRLVFSVTSDGASSPSEAMRIINNKVVLIGKTAQGLSNDGCEFSSGTNRMSMPSGNYLEINKTTGTSQTLIDFQIAAVSKGSISYNGTNVAYNTSSDYRLKENVQSVTDGIVRLQQLKPSRFNFIADPNKIVDGFIAHEVQEVVPEAIYGKKDAEDADGNPIYQGIDQSKLVPLLTAALQEAVAKIESLEARLTAAGI